MKKMKILNEFIFTCTHKGRAIISPDETEFDIRNAVQSPLGGFKSVPNTFVLDFKAGNILITNKAKAEIIRKCPLYGVNIFEQDKEGNNVTQEHLDRLSGIEDGELIAESVEPVNPYKLLPNTVLSKLSLIELENACKEQGIEVKEGIEKKEIIKLLVN